MQSLRRALDHSDFVTAPLAILSVAAAHPPRTLGDAALVAYGAFTWTLIEYCVHRAMHSRAFPSLRRLHLHHHQHPTAPSGGTLYSSLIILALIAVAISLPDLAPAALGFLIGYLGFILLHHGMHQGWSLVGPLAHLESAHNLHHHRGPNRSFGVTTTFWDKLFGTS